MTAEDVITLADRKAREAGEQWSLKPSTMNAERKRIRSAQTDRCPLEMAAGAPAGHSHSAATALGLEYWQDDACRLLIRAADDSSYVDSSFAPVRTLMLETFDFGGEVGQ